MQRFIPRDPPSWPYATFYGAVILAGVFGDWKGGALAAGQPMTLAIYAAAICLLAAGLILYGPRAG